jgi:hypothetical protein
MSDIIAGRVDLAGFQGFVACGGFSYGDVLGAGQGWAKSILFNQRAAREFAGLLLTRADTFALGVCNGCQMMSPLKDMIPGARHWPRFLRNRSEQFEARFVHGRDHAQPLDLLRWHGRQPHAHRHGRPRRGLRSREFASPADQGRPRWWRCALSTTAARRRLSFIRTTPTARPQGITGLTTADGRFTVLMPHPERVPSARCRCRGPRRAPARTRPGCACSATPGAGWADGFQESPLGGTPKQNGSRSSRFALACRLCRCQAEQLLPQGGEEGADWTTRRRTWFANISVVTKVRVAAVWAAAAWTVGFEVICRALVATA